MSRKTIVAALVLAASAALPSPAVAAAGAEEGPYHLTITVSGAGAERDGTYELTCEPAGGTHPDPEAACDALLAADAPFTEEKTGTKEAAPLCTYLYGGPATATVRGVWDGRAVDASYRRTNGCEIARWDALVPVLPSMASEQS
ncbi:SSI family serine proteinase inhibitor [Streptomyces sp. RFCAC02]|uniref:SSI family serine proteinase inhibitor n=1 Tax=Streptomyces sp. RFCAC02 TaxID=2499143 RepID=UPI001021543A|nr:SSI family serine proteinase inhibitor [Streptomyces sp. RFCAC02]